MCYLVRFFRVSRSGSAFPRIRVELDLVFLDLL